MAEVLNADITALDAKIGEVGVKEDTLLKAVTVLLSDYAQALQDANTKPAANYQTEIDALQKRSDIITSALSAVYAGDPNAVPPTVTVPVDTTPAPSDPSETAGAGSTDLESKDGTDSDSEPV